MSAHAMSDAASAAFSRLVPCPDPACHAGCVEAGLDCETCGGEGRVMPRPLEDVLADVTAKVARSSLFGAFDVEKLAGITKVRPCFGARPSEERRALNELERALWAAGHQASHALGLHYVVVRTEETRPVGDTECVHNAEPRPELVRECRAEEAALAAE